MKLSEENALLRISPHAVPTRGRAFQGSVPFGLWEIFSTGVPYAGSTPYRRRSRAVRGFGDCDCRACARDYRQGAPRNARGALEDGYRGSKGMAGVSEVADGPVTARANIERVLKEMGLAGYLDIYRADEDRVFARVLDPPAFRAVLKGWEKDPGDCSRLHPGAFASYREPGAVMPALQVCLHTGGIAEIDLDLAS